jgi:hypothetical protein
MSDKIEYESVTVEVPKQLMSFLRVEAKRRNQKLEATVQSYLVDILCSQIEAMSGEELIPHLGLNQVFFELLGDEKYGPNAKDTVEG